MSFIVCEEYPALNDSPEAEAARLQTDVEEIYEQTRTAVSSYLMYLGVSQAQAQEVAQEVYLRLYQTLRNGEEILNMRAWLFRVAHNLGLKVRKRERAFRSVNSNWDQFSGRAAVDSPERDLLEREKMRRVQVAVGQLSPQQKNCLYLRSEGLRYREIAEVLGISSSSVNEFLRRAISHLSEAVDA